MDAEVEVEVKVELASELDGTEAGSTEGTEAESMDAEAIVSSSVNFDQSTAVGSRG